MKKQLSLGHIPKTELAAPLPRKTRRGSPSEPSMFHVLLSSHLFSSLVLFRDTNSV